MKIKNILISILLLSTLGLQSCKLSRKYYGEYSEQSGGYNYVTKVYVYAKGDKIERVEILKDSIYYTDSSIWEEADTWKENEDEFLVEFIGESIKEIRKNETNTVVDNVAGASITSNRVYQAIRNALM